MMQVVIATRRSPLALWQARWVAAALQEVRPGLEVELLELSTRGDELLDRRLAPLGGKGLFIKTLENALESGRADLAVHSLKDVPAQMPSGFELAAIPRRADPRDALVSRHGPALADLPQGARVGTASLRRQAQLLAARPDLRIETVRGSVQTRLGKTDSGELDAVILAMAGLSRLEIDRGSPLPAETMLPASGQGALGIEIRSGNEPVADLLREIEDADARIAARAERSFCNALGASCAAPVAAHARVEAGAVELNVRVLASDGSKVLESAGSVPAEAAEELGRDLAADMLARGAGPLISAVD
ncbi:hydroxymethylbilane synthase [Acidihalobacter prosperus]